MKFLSAEVFPPADCTESDEGSEDQVPLNAETGGESQEKSDINIEDDESEKNEDADETTNCFEAIHANFAPSRRLKPYFFEEDTLVSLCTTQLSCTHNNCASNY